MLVTVHDHGRGSRPGGAARSLRSVLHHQGAGAGDRPGAGGLPRHHEPPSAAGSRPATPPAAAPSSGSSSTRRRPVRRPARPALHCRRVPRRPRGRRRVVDAPPAHRDPLGPRLGGACRGQRRGGAARAGDQRLRAGADRRAHAGHGRPGPAGRGAAPPPRRHRHHAERLRQPRRRHRGPQGGGLRLRLQALQAGRGGAGPRARPRSASGWRARIAGSAPSCAAGCRPGASWASSRGDAGGAAAARQGCAAEDHRAGPGRVGHRQGAGGPGAPRPLAARAAALRGRQLRRHPRRAARVGALRPRTRRLHRRGARQEGAGGRGRRRHALPRRDRRAAARSCR